MTCIRDIRLIGLEWAMPPIRAYGMARGVMAHRRATLVEVETEDGVVGIGECFGPFRSTAGYLADTKDAWLGRDLFDRAQVWNDLICRRYHLGLQNQLTALVSGIDIAIHDAIGKTLGLPVCKLIGGQSEDRLPVYASDGYLTGDPQNQLEAQLERVVDRGYPAAKIKIGRNPKDDEARVRLARRMLGDEMLLLVDVNGNYTVDLTLESMRRTRDYDVHFYEEPLPPQDFAGYRRLAARAPIPVATGEALFTMFDFHRLLEGGGVDLVQPDLTLCGGYDQARAIAMLAQLHNVRFTPHVWGSAVGLAAALHLVTALPRYPHTDNLPYPTLVEYDIGENPLRDDLLTEPLRPLAGRIALPQGPGLGIELNPEVIARHRIA